MSQEGILTTTTPERFTPTQVLLTPKQVSDWTGLSVPALAGLRYTGKGPKYHALTAKTIRYLEADVKAWIDASGRTITGS